MRGVIVLLLLACTIACAKPTVRWSAASPVPDSVFSEGDGLVVVTVRSSTTTVPIDPVILEFENLDLRYRLSYSVRGPALLLEPGRYRVTNIVFESRQAQVTSEPFRVRTGRVVVLPSVNVDVDESGLNFVAHLEASHHLTPADFAEVLRDSAWIARRWAWVEADPTRTFTLTTRRYKVYQRR